MVAVSGGVTVHAGTDRNHTVGIRTKINRRARGIAARNTEMKVVFAEPVLGHQRRDNQGAATRGKPAHGLTGAGPQRATPYHNHWLTTTGNHLCRGLDDGRIGSRPDRRQQRG